MSRPEFVRSLIAGLQAAIKSGNSELAGFYQRHLDLVL